MSASNPQESEPAGAPLRLAPVLQYDDADTPCDVIDALVLEDFVTGRYPWSQTVRLARNRSGAPVVPDGARVLRTSVEPRQRSRLIAGDGWSARLVDWKGRGGEVTVSAVDEAVGQAVLDRIMAGTAAPEPTDSVEIGFWHLNPRRGAQRDARPITAPDWADIRANYTGAARRAIDDLMAVTPQTISGRLVLLHGAPGTGKTTALRALAGRWRSWCQVDCLLDPDELFANPSYLSEVAVGEEDDSDDEARDGRWRLLILEDCDELIRGEARQTAGQALSRLLNLTDGLLGQGRDVLVAVTTNEDLARLHPAVVRPGRCLARIEVGPLSYPEATAWLGSAAGVPAGGATLAELYALRSGAPAAPAVPEIGGYL